MELTLTLTGVVPLIVQSDELVNPLGERTKAIRTLTAKRTRKTEDDIAEIGRLEFFGSLYYDPKAGPYLPGANIQASLKEGGSFAGRLGKAVERAVLVKEDMNPIEYSGPREIQKLYADPKFRFVRSVKVQAARTMRTRPIFPSWRVRTTVTLATDLLNLEDFERVAELAGSMVGIGTWRPRYGRYEVEIGRA